MDWRSIRPDLNSIHNLWGFLVCSVYTGFNQFDYEDSMSEEIGDVWNSFTAEDFKALVESMAHRLAGILEAKGGTYFISRFVARNESCILY